MLLTFLGLPIYHVQYRSAVVLQAVG